MKQSNGKVSDPTLPVFQARFEYFGVKGIVPSMSNPPVMGVSDFQDASVHMNDDKPLSGFNLERGDVLHFGIDSEYVYDEQNECNIVISYQYCIIFEDMPPLKGIIYTDIGKKLRDGELTSAIKSNGKAKVFNAKFKQKDRWEFKKLISRLIELAKNEFHLPSWSGEVNVYCHFLRADFATFSDFFNFKVSVRGVRSTVAGCATIYGVDEKTVGGKFFKPQVMKLYDENRNAKNTKVTFIDTLLLAPNKVGLAEIGRLINLPKLSLPTSYSIERMDLLLAGDKVAFEAYAVRDAEIAVYYGLFMQVFVRNVLRLNHLPMTLAGIGLTKFSKFMKEKNVDLNALFGKHEVKSAGWDRSRGKATYRSQLVVKPQKKLFESLATDSYMGGRNECFATGITPVGNWNDFDVTSAYTVAMLHLRPLDFSKKTYIGNTTDCSEFICDVVGMAYVSFVFPAGTSKPSLPVKTENGLIYPLSGDTYATSPEIQVAIGLGCVIKIHHGVIVPFVERSERVFLDFVKVMRDLRKTFVKSDGKGSLMDLLCKEISNCLYGKTAQGLLDKSTFEISTGLSKKLPRSLISCPYFASYISGLIRALVSEQIASIPSQYKVLSVTTDGFLTNAPLEAIDLTLPASTHFKSLLRLIDHKGEILERKHGAKQLAMMKTRGQLTVIPDDSFSVDDPEGYKTLITAKCSVKPPCDKSDHNEWMVRLYLNRYPEKTVTHSSIISLREQFFTRSDLIGVQRDVRLNLEPDFKRRLVNPVMQSYEFNELQGGHIYLESEPWNDVDEFGVNRTAFNAWTKGSEVLDKKTGVASVVSGHCLMTLEDWHDWVEYQATMSYLKNVKGFKISGDKTMTAILLRLFFAAYSHKQWGLDGTLSVKSVVTILNNAGYEANENDFTYPTRSGKAYVENPLLPLTKGVEDLLRLLLKHFSELNLSCVLSKKDIAVFAAK